MVDRVYESGASVTAPSAPASPSVGYPRPGNPATSTPATKPGAWWYHMITEEQVSVVEGAGMTPGHTDVTQLLRAVRTLSGGVVGGAQRLRMSVAAASATATLTADELVLSTALGGQLFRLGNFSKTINLATTGAGGMDTGTAPVSGYVAIYAIYNPTTKVSALLAVNATSAAAPEVYGGANMPAGYTASALVSVWPTNASSQFKPGNQRGRRVELPSATAVSTSSPPTTLTALSLAALIPKNAAVVKGRLAMYATGTTTVYSLFAAADASNTGHQGQVGYTAPGGSVEGNFEMSLITEQTIYYYTASIVASSTYSVFIVGYQF